MSARSALTVAAGHELSDRVDAARRRFEWLRSQHLASIDRSLALRETTRRLRHDARRARADRPRMSDRRGSFVLVGSVDGQSVTASYTDGVLVAGGSVELSAGEGSSSRDAVAGAVVIGRLLLEEGQDALGTVGSPRGDESAVGLGERLRGGHARTLAHAAFGHSGGGGGELPRSAASRDRRQQFGATRRDSG